MPQTRVVFYRDADGSVPLVEWLNGLSRKAQDKCRIRIERLRELGHELRRPEADYLRDGIYELRARLRTTNYRVLYFFHGNTAVVLTHGLTKERAVPANEIDKAIAFKKKFMRDPEGHTSEETRQ